MTAAMSRENVELVRQEIGVFNDRSADPEESLREIWHPKIVLDAIGVPVPHGFAEPGIFEGPESVFERLMDTWPAVGDVLIADGEIVDAGDRVVVAWQFRYADEIHGTRFRVVSFKDGRIWQIREYMTREEAVEAAGLPQ